MIIFNHSLLAILTKMTNPKYSADGFFVLFVFSSKILQIKLEIGKSNFFPKSQLELELEGSQNSAEYVRVLTISHPVTCHINLRISHRF